MSRLPGLVVDVLRRELEHARRQLNEARDRQVRTEAQLRDDMRSVGHAGQRVEQLEATLRAHREAIQAENEAARDAGVYAGPTLADRSREPRDTTARMSPAPMSGEPLRGKDSDPAAGEVVGCVQCRTAPGAPHAVDCPSRPEGETALFVRMPGEPPAPVRAGTLGAVRAVAREPIELDAPRTQADDDRRAR